MSAASLLAMTATACVTSTPAAALTCEDVRGLSQAERDYWSKRLNISTEERRQIWLTCYKDYHPNVVVQLVRR